MVHCRDDVRGSVVPDGDLERRILALWSQLVEQLDLQLDAGTRVRRQQRVERRVGGAGS